MKHSSLLQVVVPILNERVHLPKLLQSLASQQDAFIALVLVDNGSTDGSYAFIKNWKNPAHSSIKKLKILREKKRGYAPPLNRGLALEFSANLAILDANTFPEKNWAKSLLAAFSAGDTLLVGQTESLLSSSPSPAEKLAQIFFTNFSERAASAIAHALPWGPNCNLAFTRSLWKKTGVYLEASGPALDLDWCWRALFAGAAIRYIPQALAYHQRRNDEMEFLQQMHRYGQAEHWLIERFANLLGAEKPKSILEQCLAGAERILTMPVPEELLAIRLKAAIAFSAGIQFGSSRKVPVWQKKLSKKAYGWPLSPDRSCLWHSKFGVAELGGDENLVWQGLIRSQPTEEIAALLAKKNHWTIAEGKKFVAAFQKELSHG